MKTPPKAALCLELYSSELRMSILKALEGGPKNVTQLQELTQAERTRVSHALSELKNCNHISATKQGRNVIYTLKKHTPVSEKGSILELLDKHVQHNCQTCHRCK